MRCQKLWQNKSSRWGSLEVKYLWIAPVVTKHVLSFSFGAMPNALWMCELRRSPENQLWQASFSGNAEYILPKQRMKRKVCDTHISLTMVLAYKNLQDWVIFFGQMLVFIFQHHGSHMGCAGRKNLARQTPKPNWSLPWWSDGPRKMLESLL